VDEAHERSVDCDLLLCLLREILRRRVKCAAQHVGTMAPVNSCPEQIPLEDYPRLIVMSATVNTARYLEYFELLGSDKICVLDVPGRAFPVKAHFLEDIIELVGSTTSAAVLAPPPSKLPSGVWHKSSGNACWQPTSEASSRYSANTIATLRAIDDRYIPLGIVAAVLRWRLRLPDSQGVIIFMPGQKEITATKHWLESDEELQARCVFVEFHSTAGVQAHRAAFAAVPSHLMKVIISTNIAETSLTILGVDCVIDSGLIRINDELKGFLRTIWAGKSNTKQRCGRAGRVRPGDYFALFTAEWHSGLVEHVPPEITRKNLSRLVLFVHELGIAPSWLLQETMDSPSQRQVCDAENELRTLRAVGADQKITDLGRLLSSLPVDPSLGVALILSVVLGLHVPMSKVIAVLSVDATPFNVANGPRSGEQASIQVLRSDVLKIALLLVRFEQCETAESRQSLCEEEGLSLHAMQIMETASWHLLDNLTRLDPTGAENTRNVHDVIQREHLQLSLLLSLGLTGKITLHRGSGRLSMHGGNAKADRNSLWAAGGPLTNSASAPTMLVYGSSLPIQGQKICQKLTEVPLEALLLFSPRLEWCKDKAVLNGWLNVQGPFSDLAIIGAVGRGLWDVLEKAAERMLKPNSFMHTGAGIFGGYETWKREELLKQLEQDIDDEGLYCRFLSDLPQLSQVVQ